VLERSFHVRKHNERVLNASSVRNEQNVPNVRSNSGILRENMFVYAKDNANDIQKDKANNKDTYSGLNDQGQGKGLTSPT